VICPDIPIRTYQPPNRDEMGFITTDENPGEVPKVSDPHPARSAEITTKPSPQRGGGGVGGFVTVVKPKLF
jgi:hypothetical protein